MIFCGFGVSTRSAQAAPRPPGPPTRRGGTRRALLLLPAFFFPQPSTWSRHDAHWRTGKGRFLAGYKPGAEWGARGEMAQTDHAMVMCQVCRRCAGTGRCDVAMRPMPSALRQPAAPRPCRPCAVLRGPARCFPYRPAFLLPHPKCHMWWAPQVAYSAKIWHLTGASPPPSTWDVRRWTIRSPDTPWRRELAHAQSRLELHAAPAFFLSAAARGQSQAESRLCGRHLGPCLSGGPALPGSTPTVTAATTFGSWSVPGSVINRSHGCTTHVIELSYLPHIFRYQTACPLFPARIADLQRGRPAARRREITAPIAEKLTHGGVTGMRRHASGMWSDRRPTPVIGQPLQIFLLTQTMGSSLAVTPHANPAVHTNSNALSTRPWPDCQRLAQRFRAPG